MKLSTAQAHVGTAVPGCPASVDARSVLVRVTEPTQPRSPVRKHEQSPRGPPLSHNFALGEIKRDSYQGEPSGAEGDHEFLLASHPRH